MDVNKNRIQNNAVLIEKDCLKVGKNYIVVYFNGIRKVLSTSALNGGIHNNLRAVFNLDGKPEDGSEIALKGGTYESHLRHESFSLLGVSGDASTGMMTAADMKHAAVSSRQYEKLAVTAIVTGGIEKNGGRAGDPALWQEEAGIWREAPPEKSQETEKKVQKQPPQEKLGTINIMLFINAALTDGALERALVTCTEAKTAAIQELSIDSRYSCGIATGSGTDGTILVSNSESQMHLTEAGKHCKLGELIGCTVKEAVKEALYRQTGVGAGLQKDAFRRLRRHGIDESQLWEFALEQKLTEPGNRMHFKSQAERWARDPHIAAWSILEGYLQDEKLWGMLDSGEAGEAEESLWRGFFGESRKAMGDTRDIRRRIVGQILDMEDD